VHIWGAAMQDLFRTSAGSALRARISLVALLAALSGTSVLASEQSSLLIEDGLATMQTGDLLGATERFIDAYDADPADPEAAFYVGVGMNRMGDFVQAVAALDEAQRLGYAGSELDFEMGWALLAVGQYDRAIARLEAYEAANPGYGKTSEFLGRAWLAKGDTARAQELFEQAVARDPSLASSVAVQMATIEASQGNPAEAAAFLDSIVANDPSSPLGQYLGQELAQLAPEAAGTPKVWSVVASFAVGHDSNAIALGDASPLPSGITNQSGSFVESAVSGQYTVFSRPGVDRLDINGAVGLRRYGDNLTVVDSEFWSIGADYQGLIRKDLVGRVQGYLGGNTSHLDVSNRYAGVRGSVQFDSFDVLWEPWVSMTYVDYNQDGFVAPADDRDGNTWGLGVNSYWTWDLIETDLRAGGAYGSSQTKGSNFDNHSWSAVIGLSKELADEVVADISFTMINTNYDNADTRATPPGAFNRADRTRYFTFQLSKPVWQNVSLFGRATITHNSSNITAFAYDRLETVAGIAASF
jgi:tetratricopeptide (TPR) repeat protein